MAITKKDVTYIAALARLGLTEDEIEHFGGQLESILGYIDKLKSLDVSEVPPTAHVLDIKNVYRPDAVMPSLPADKILKCAPATEGQFFKVPKVIE
jgi:aspartyl-tRNA(Asn)/glutamyl-tRNA(Gln) amidotransferase subunit C